jgi:hypothetical protein
MAKPKLAESGVKRKGPWGLMGITAAITLAVGFISFILPPVAAAINHGIERISNGIKARRELKARADWYRPQIAQTLGMDPAKVTVSDFKKAAQINPTLAAAVKDVYRTKAKDNRSSVLVNVATAVIPGAELAKDAATAVKVASVATTIGKQVAVTTAGGLLMDWVSKEHVNAQEVIEGISSQLNGAHEQGKDPREVVTPQMLFLLRVSQDEALEEEIKHRYKKPFQKMSESEQQAVMLDYKPLADAVTSEAYAVAQGIMPVQDLMARAPNLKSGANKYALGATNGSFVENLQQQRATAAQRTSGAAV